MRAVVGAAASRTFVMNDLTQEAKYKITGSDLFRTR